jgi:hypothetical protein
MIGVTQKWVEGLSEIELFILNTLQKNKEHLNCRLIIKETYCDWLHRPAIYCADHDRFLSWVKDDSYYPLHTLEHYEILGINAVEYPEDDTKERIRKEHGYGHSKLKGITVKNYRAGHKTRIWHGYKGNPYRDPSMPEYWDFIETFL